MLEGLQRLLEDDDPYRIEQWIYRAQGARLLGRIANEGQVITHALLDGCPKSEHVRYLRRVLVLSGILAERDEKNAGLEAWLEHTLERVPLAQQQ